jgi:hypothetical protein
MESEGRWPTHQFRILFGIRGCARSQFYRDERAARICELPAARAAPGVYNIRCKTGYYSEPPARPRYVPKDY